jgi:hypothetical protein
MLSLISQAENRCCLAAYGQIFGAAMSILRIITVESQYGNYAGHNLCGYCRRHSVYSLYSFPGTEFLFLWKKSCNSPVENSD